MTELKPRPDGYPIKLVRDGTPGIINSTGEPGDLFYEILEDRKEYMEALYRKLGEEVTEFLLTKGAEELVDVYEVVRTIGNAYGVELEWAADQDPRGGFKFGVMMYGRHPEFDR